MTNSPAEFYRSLADGYDDMTGFDKRLARDEAVLRRWVKQYQIRSAIDVGCGTGAHAVVLARLGVRVVGTDLSEEMLARARENARRHAAQVDWFAAPMQQLRQQLNDRFHAIFCLGNTLPHVLEPADLQQTFRGFHDLLVPGGLLLLQLLNYERVLAQRQRLVGVNRSGDTEYVRFYDFETDTIRFNILNLKWSGGQATHSLTSTTLRPYGLADLAPQLQEAGFGEQSSFSDLNSAPFDPQRSGNLVIAARREQ